MLIPLIQNNLTYPQPSVTLDGNTIYLSFRGDEIGDIAIRGLTAIDISDPRFEIQATSPATGFYNGVLKLLDDTSIDTSNDFDIIISGVSLLDNSNFSETFTISVIQQGLPTTPIYPTRPETPGRPSFDPTVPPLTIDIQWQLEVIPSNKIMVPGCEPTSALSSTKLSSWMAESGCKNVLVNVDDALEAIPGSYLKYGSNWGRGNMRQKWFVMPPISPDCPCEEYPDYYKILREIASEEAPVEDVYDACNISGMGYCPSGDFVDPPPDDPYVDEGTFPGDVGILPPVPPWGTSGT